MHKRAMQNTRTWKRDLRIALRKRLLRTFLALFALGGAVPGASAEGPTPAISGPPFDTPLTVTSSFGEFRRGHFHGGVDLSTEQKIGKPVLAVADGWVWRVRASGSGYGRCLYYRTVDGFTIVNAHLDHFAPAIQAFVEAAQESLSRYEVDLSPGPGRLPVKAGDVVAWSGDSGVGPPHLHFELRSGHDADIGRNPLVDAVQVPDSLPPHVGGILVRPFGPGGRVNGGTASFTIPVSVDGGVFHAKTSTRITGAATVSVRTFDPSGTGNRLGPAGARLIVDGVERYAIDFTAFDWNHAHEVELAWDFGRARHGDDFVLRLYRPIGASQALFGDWKPLAGLLSPEGESPLAAGPHEGLVVVHDKAGNETRVQFPFTIDAAPSTPALPALSESGSKGTARSVPVSIDLRTNALDVSLAGPVPERELYALLETPLGSTAAAFTARGKESRSASLLIPEGLYPETHLAIVTRAGDVLRTISRVNLDMAVVTRGPETTLAWNEISLAAPGNAFFGPGAIRFSRRPVAAAPGLTPVGAGIFLDTDDMVLDRPVTVCLVLPAGVDRKHAGLCRLDDDGGWTWLSRATESDTLKGDTRYLTAFGIFLDAVPPRIKLWKPAAGVAAGTRPDIFAGLSDSGSGFSWSNIETTIDGVPQIAVYDPESGTLRGRSRRELARGRHTIAIRLTDRAGNETTESAEFVAR